MAELVMLADIQRTVYPEKVTRQLHVMVQARESSSTVKLELTAIVSEDPLLFSTPMPHHDSAVLGSRHHITVLTDVAF